MGEDKMGVEGTKAAPSAPPPPSAPTDASQQARATKAISGQVKQGLSGLDVRVRHDLAEVMDSRTQAYQTDALLQLVLDVKDDLRDRQRLVADNAANTNVYLMLEDAGEDLERDLGLKKLGAASAALNGAIKQAIKQIEEEDDAVFEIGTKVAKLHEIYSPPQKIGHVISQVNETRKAILQLIEYIKVYLRKRQGRAAENKEPFSLAAVGENLLKNYKSRRPQEKYKEDIDMVEGTIAQAITEIKEEDARATPEALGLELRAAKLLRSIHFPF
jgi:hypothetical protein